MNEKEAIKQAIVILKTEYDSEGFYIPLFKTKQKALALLEQAEPPLKDVSHGSVLCTCVECTSMRENERLQAEPPPAGEWTKKIREELRVASQVCELTGPEKLLWEACDRLDTQQQEIEKLKDVPKIIARNIKAGAVTLYWVEDFCEQALKGKNP